MNESMKSEVTLIQSGKNTYDLRAIFVASNQSFESQEVLIGKPSNVSFDVEGLSHIQIHLNSTESLKSIGSLMSKPLNWYKESLEISENIVQVAFHFILNKEILLHTYVMDLQDDISVSDDTRQKLSTLENVAREFENRGFEGIRLMKKSKDRPH